MRPDPSDPTHPARRRGLRLSDHGPVRAQALKGSGVHIAVRGDRVSRAARPSPSIKVQETRETVAAGADEIDMVIDRGAFLSGNYQKVFDEIAEVKEACGPAHLKVILETGELANYDQVRTRVAHRDVRRRRFHQDLDRQSRPSTPRCR